MVLMFKKNLIIAYNNNKFKSSFTILDKTNISINDKITIFVIH